MIPSTDSQVTCTENRIVFAHLQTVFRADVNSAGLFPCPCPKHNGSKVYDKDGLVHHFLNWQDALLKRHGPHELPQYLNTVLMDTPTLRKCNLAVNIEWHLLVCLMCKRAVLPTTVEAHLRTSHSLIAGNLDDYLAQFCLPPTFPPHPTVVTEAIEGIDVVDGFQCPHCPAVYTTCFSMETHFSKQHSTLPRTKDYAETKAQQLSAGGAARAYFAVTLPEDTLMPAVEEDHAQHITETYEDIESGQAGSTLSYDIRNVAVWLRTTKWHEHLAPYTPDTLLSLVDLPEKDEYPLLKKAVETLFEECCNYIDHTSILVLQRLNSDDIAKDGINNSPFSRHQHHEERMALYIFPVFHLLCMLLRRGPSYHIGLPREIEDKVFELHKAVCGDSIPAAVTAAYDVLLSIWTRKWETTAISPVSDPTLHFLMIASLNIDGTFKEPKRMTSTIAQLEYTMRCVFLKAMHASEDVEANCMALQPWFQEKLDSPFNTICNLQTFLSAIAYNTVNLPTVWWIDRENYTSLFFRGVRMELHQITGMVEAMEQEAVSLFQQLVCGLDLSVSYDSIRDDLSNVTPGYSFLNDPYNTMFCDRTRLATAIMNTPDLHGDYITFQNGSTVTWNISRLRKWLRIYGQFQLLQLTRTMITAGSPSRGTELTAMLLCNSPTGTTRNMVMLGSHLTLLCTYNKTSALTGQDKLIPHALDAFSSDLMIQDLAVLRPFAELATYMVYPDTTNAVTILRRHVFPSPTSRNLFTTKDITGSLEKWTTAHLGGKIGTNGWRHLSTAFRRKLTPRLFELADLDTEDSIPALQSGHSRATENRVYGISADNLGGAPEDLLPMFVEASTDWQKILRVVPGGLALPFYNAKCSVFDELVAKGSIRLVSPSDSAQKSIVKAVQPLFAQLREDMQRMFEESKKGRAYSPLDSLAEAGMSDFATSVSRSSSPVSSGVDPSLPSDIEEQALDALRRLLCRPRAQWNSLNQKQAVKTALELQNDLIAILPTGSGKSMVPIIPAILEKNTVTVLIIPLRALIQDYERRLTKLLVPFEIYDNRPIVGNTNLLLVSADVVRSPLWRQHIMILNQRKRVVRQIFDEAHIPLIDQDFRTSLQDMHEIREPLIGQLCLLSATIPPRAEAVLMSTFGIGTNRVVLRGNTNRPELRYMWSPPTAVKIAEEHAIAHATGFVWTSPEERGLIFVSSIPIGSYLAESLSCPLYTSQTPDRTATYRAWIEGSTSRFMVCTSAFGAGNDYPHVRVVIHVGTPHHMVNYIQEVSRAGRDGKPGQCILLPTNTRVPDVSEGEQDIAGRWDMHRALQQRSTCIRHQLTTFADGTGISCGEDHRNEPCSYCQERTDDIPDIPHATENPKRSLEDAFEPATALAKRRKVTCELTALDAVEKAISTMNQFNSVCLYCSLSSINCQFHVLDKCPTFVNAGLWADFKAFKAKIRYSSSQSVCYKCHVPQGPDYKIHPKNQPGVPISCSFPDRLLPLAFGIFKSDHFRRLAERYFELRLEDISQFQSWLNGPLVIGGVGTNLFSLFLWFADL